MPSAMRDALSKIPAPKPEDLTSEAMVDMASLWMAWAQWDLASPKALGYMRTRVQQQRELIAERTGARAKKA